VLFRSLPEKANKEAANALLKIIEEPPPRTIFLFVSEHRESVLTTILSRCQNIPVRRFSEQEVAEYLVKHQDVEKSRAETLAGIADGNLDITIKRLTEEANQHSEWFRTWMRKCYELDHVALNNLAEEYHKHPMAEQLNLLLYGLFIFRHVILTKAGANELIRAGEQEGAFIQKFGGVLELQQIDQLMDLFNKSIYQIERNIYARLLFLHLSHEVGKILRGQLKQ